MKPKTQKKMIVKQTEKNGKLLIIQMLTIESFKQKHKIKRLANRHMANIAFLLRQQSREERNGVATYIT